LESFNQFLDAWARLYPNYILISVFLVIVTLIAIPIVFFILNLTSYSNLEKKVKEGKAVVFVTKNSIPTFISFMFILILSLILMIVPSFFRWLLQLPPVSPQFYAIFNFIILYVIFMIKWVPILNKIHPSRYYIGKNYMLLLTNSNYGFIPIHSIDTIFIDKKDKMVKFIFKVNNLKFLIGKAKIKCYFNNKLVFEDLINRLQENNFPIQEKPLKNLLDSLIRYSFLLNEEINPSFFDKLPVKLQNLIQNSPLLITKNET
jgi:hypothetical protein